MKVVLVNHSENYYALNSTSSLTLGKIYDAENMRYETSDGRIGYYKIRNDYGKEVYYKASYFKLLSDVREEMIKSLLS